MLTYSSSLLIIGAGANQVPAIKLAKARGLRVVVTDMNPEAEGITLADDFGLVSTRDAEATVEFAKSIQRELPLTGVMTMASESAVTVAAVADALGLPGVNKQAAWLATNKVERQKAFNQAGVSAPKFTFATTLAEAKAAASKLGFPVVLKPADSAGSRGVQKINSTSELSLAIEEIRSISKRPEFLIEEFLVGSEHSIEGLVVNGQVIWTGFSDRNYEKKELYPPYFLEDGDTLPTSLSDLQLEQCKQIATQAVAALGINWGPVKGDILIDATGPRMLEMAARLSGDYFCYETVPLHNGCNLLEAVMDLALGLEVNLDKLKPRFNRGVALRYVWPKPGVVKAIDGIEEVREMKGVHFFRFEPHWKDLKVGDKITAAKSMGERVGCVMAYGDTREDAVRIAEEAVRKIKIVTE